MKFRLAKIVNSLKVFAWLGFVSSLVFHVLSMFANVENQYYLLNFLSIQFLGCIFIKAVIWVLSHMSHERKVNREKIWKLIITGSPSWVSMMFKMFLVYGCIVLFYHIPGIVQ
jgi:hypothetical protein